MDDTEPVLLADLLPELRDAQVGRSLIPRVGVAGDYRVDVAASIRSVEGTELVTFGTTVSGHMAIDLVKLHVVEWIPDAGISFVNSTVGQFAALTARVSRDLRLDHHANDEAACVAAAAAARRIIGEIDPPALEEGTFWAEFADDVEMGDYSVGS